MAPKPSFSAVMVSLISALLGRFIKAFVASSNRGQIQPRF